jgi:two-component system cell cycle sensor histidine kinase/response regulator CckA
VEELQVSLEELQMTVEELERKNWELLETNRRLQEVSQSLRAARHEVDLERQWYLNFFHYAPTGYIVTDSNGVVQEANFATETLLAPTGNTLTGTALEKYLANGKGAMLRQQIVRLRTVDEVGLLTLRSCRRWECRSMRS